jgi:hypothetical protein
MVRRGTQYTIKCGKGKLEACSLNQCLPERITYILNIILPTLMLCIFIEVRLNCDSWKQNVRDKVRFNLNRHSK